MARLPRCVVPGSTHYIAQRAAPGRTVFLAPEDSRYYLRLLRECADKAGLHILAWCMMPDQVRLVAVPEHDDSLRAAVAETNRRYARRINDREQRSDHLWYGRFHSFPMDDNYAFEAVREVELAPVRTGLCEDPTNWRWSSAHARLRNRIDPLIVDDTLPEEYGDWRAFLNAAAHQGTNARAALHRHMRTGRPLGDDAFHAHVQRVTGRDLRPGKPGPRRKRRQASIASDA